MKVRDLIEQLQKLDPEIEVYSYDHEQDFCFFEVELAVVDTHLGKANKFGVPVHDPLWPSNEPTGKGVILR